MIKSSGRKWPGLRRFDRATASGRLRGQSGFVRITNRSESTLSSAFGKLIACRVGNSLECRPEYEAEGANNWFVFSPGAP
jgi:hypothetical protein